LNTLNSLIRDKPEDQWVKALAATQQALNNAVNKTTQKTLNKLLFGYKPSPLCEAELVNNLTEAGERQNLKVIHARARKLFDEDQKRQMKRFNAKRFIQQPIRLVI
jgi:hypothetical protein